jgi:MFS family permease
VPFLVPAARLGQANGLVQLIQAGSALVSPLVAATLLSVASIQTVLWADVGTFLFGILTLLVTPFSETKDESRASLDASQATSKSTSLWQQSLEGLRYFSSNSRLMVLVSQTMMGALIFGCLSVLSQPLVLSFASTQSLAVVMSLGGVAMLVGSILMAVWGGPKNRGLGLLVGGLVSGECVIAIAFTTQFALFTAIACLFFATLPVMNSLTYTLLQHHVMPAMLGRAMAVLQSASYAASIISYLLAGTLADRIFEPAMLAEGALSRWAGPYLGVGNGRGIALMCVMLGLLLLISALISYRYRLDREWASMPSAQ